MKCPSELPTYALPSRTAGEPTTHDVRWLDRHFRSPVAKSTA
jgi:hypothetical protein